MHLGQRRRNHFNCFFIHSIYKLTNITKKLLNNTYRNNTSGSNYINTRLKYTKKIHQKLQLWGHTSSDGTLTITNWQSCKLLRSTSYAICKNEGTRPLCSLPPPVPMSLPINKTHLPIWQQVSKGDRIDGAIETSVQPQFVSTQVPFSFQIIEFCGN